MAFKTSSNGIAIKNRQLNSIGPKKLVLTKDNSFLVFPFELVAGYITSTENGLRQNDNVDIADYSNFQRVFTGLENMLAKWDGAYTVEKKNDTDTFLTKTYSVGRNIRGYIPNETLGATFEASTISSDFLTEFTDEEFTIHAYDDIEERDLFKLFIIPELREQKWLYISRAERYFHNGKFHHVEITMTTLNNKVAKSGKAIEEFIQRSAPGEGYAWPIVDQDQNVSLDEIRTRDVPITSLQIEMAGPAGFNTIIAYGRPTIQKTVDGITQSTFNPKIEAPRLLLPLRLETAIPSPENTRPAAETDYYVGDFQPTLHTQYKSWKEQFQGSYDLSMRNQYEGVLIATQKLSELRTSNPVDAKGTHTHELWDTAFKPTLSGTYSTAANNLTGDSLDFGGQPYSIAELLTHNFFATSHLVSMPLTTQQNVAWSLQDIPLVGGFLSKLTLGVPIGWQNLSVRLGMPSVKLIMPASIAEYGNVLKGGTSTDDSVWIPLETFTAERKDEATEYSGINATGTIFKVQLTHRFKKTINGKEYVFDTKDLGQIQPLVDDDGIGIDFGGNIPVLLLWDITCKPTGRGNTPGYVIDMPHFKALARLEYRQTFFSNDTQVATATYETQAKFTGSIRDWTNTIKMSNWNETNNKVINYPAAIVAPKPPNTNYPKLTLLENFISNIKPDNVASAPSYKPFFDSIGAVDVPKTGDFTKKDISMAETRIDLEKVGGTQSLKDNYEKLIINLSTNVNNQQIEIDTNELITSSQKTFELHWFKRYFNFNILLINPLAIGREETEFNTTISYAETIKVKLEISGNELVISTTANIIGRSGLVDQNDPTKIWERTTTINQRPNWEQQPDFKINSLIAVPKPFITP